VDLTGGIAAFDAHCQAEADTRGGIFIGRSFRALVATTSQSPAERFDMSRPTWARLDGVRLFERASDLHQGIANTTVGYLASGARSLAPIVALGSGHVGQRASSEADNCGDWQTDDDGTVVRTSRSTTIDWVTDDATLPCRFSNAVYCFEE